MGGKRERIGGARSTHGLLTFLYVNFCPFKKDKKNRPLFEGKTRKVIGMSLDIVRSMANIESNGDRHNQIPLLAQCFGAQAICRGRRCGCMKRLKLELFVLFFVLFLARTTAIR